MQGLAPAGCREQPKPKVKTQDFSRLPLRWLESPGFNSSHGAPPVRPAPAEALPPPQNCVLYHRGREEGLERALPGHGV